MICNRCSGFCVEEVERDMVEGVDVGITRCVNCGDRQYRPMTHAPIEVIRGKYYERGWSY